MKFNSVSIQFGEFDVITSVILASKRFTDTLGGFEFPSTIPYNKSTDSDIGYSNLSEVTSNGLNLSFTASELQNDYYEDGSEGTKRILGVYIELNLSGTAFLFTKSDEITNADSFTLFGDNVFIFNLITSPLVDLRNKTHRISTSTHILEMEDPNHVGVPKSDIRDYTEFNYNFK